MSETVGDKTLTWLWSVARDSPQPLTRKRMIKLTRQVADAEITATFDIAVNGDILAYIVDDGAGQRLEFWRHRQARIARALDYIDDTPEILRFAQTQLLLKRGYPIFNSYAEVDAWAASRNWPTWRSCR